MKKVAFISGKISEDKNYKEKFKMAQIYLESLGCLVLSPAVLPALSWCACMRITLAMMREADCIVFLPDWMDSPGARMEFYYALLWGKHVQFLATSDIKAWTEVHG